MVTSYLIFGVVAIILGGLLSVQHHFGTVVAISANGSLVASSAQHSSTPVSKPALSHGLTLKIISPIKGQQVPAGNNLTISGISSDTSSMDCQVSLLLNDLKPYQKATPTGKSNSGGSDYSTWKYTINNKSSPIKEGLNKITSKLTCNSPSQPNGISKWFSVNVTGASKMNVTGHTVPSKVPINNVLNHTNTNFALHTNSTKPSPLRLTTSTYKPIEPTNIAAKPNASINGGRILSAFLDVSKDPIVPGQKQTIKIIVADGITNARIAGAKVTTDIQPSSSSIIERQFVGTTGPDGKISKSWKMTDEGKSETTYNIFSKVSAVGYKDKVISGTFKSSTPQNTVDNLNSKVDDLSNRIINEVKKGFDQNALMPNLPIPFN